MGARVRFSTVVVLAATTSLVLTVAGRVVSGQAQQQSPPTLAERVSEMRHHFVEVVRLHEAVIRGDLGGAREPAAALGRVEAPANFSDVALPFVTTIREAGRTAATAPNLRTAARATVNALQQCGACHRAVFIYPAPPATARPEVGGFVGHMGAHQRALDAMLRGLVVPSDSSWREGAGRLDTLTVAPNDWPRDAKLTEQARQADAALHKLAARALKASSPSDRADVYVEVLTTCASCHGLRPNVWGPRSQ